MKTLAPSNTRTYRVRTQSGIWGWRSRLRAQYRDLEDFIGYAANHGLAERLGYASGEDAWEANPIVEGSTNPRDYRRVAA